MHAHDTLNTHWHMGGSEWTLAVAFWALAIPVVVILYFSWQRTPRRVARAVTPEPVVTEGRWWSVPELRLAILGLPLQLLWEIAQFPLYTVWHQNDWSYILYGLAHCTLGDLLILVVSYELVALLNRNRHWIDGRVVLNALLFTLAGIGYTIYSEMINVRVRGTWGYTETMPLLPFIGIGATPILQWLLIPPTLLWLMRLTGSGHALPGK